MDFKGIKRALLSLLFLISFSVQGKIFEYSTHTEIENELERVVSILQDVENFCESNCPYIMRGVVEQKVVEQREDGFIFWSHLKGHKTLKAFSVLRIARVNDHQINVSFEYPSKEERERLSAQYGLPHRSVFSSLSVSWNLTELDNGKVGATAIDYSFVGESNDPLLIRFRRRVISEIRKTFFKMVTHLKL